LEHLVCKRSKYREMCTSNPGADCSCRRIYTPFPAINNCLFITIVPSITLCHPTNLDVQIAIKHRYYIR
jgi:hypothetical protein